LNFKIEELSIGGISTRLCDTEFKSEKKENHLQGPRAPSCHFPFPMSLPAAAARLPPPPAVLPPGASRLFSHYYLPVDVFAAWHGNIIMFSFLRRSKVRSNAVSVAVSR
jgi:hypothetical protein